MREYGADQMAIDLRSLDEWKRIHGRAALPRYQKELQAGNDDALRIDAARRRVTSYFLRAVALTNVGAVPSRLLEQVVDPYGARILLDVIEPLEYGLNPDRSSDVFRQMENLLEGKMPRSWRGLAVPPKRAPPAE